MADESIPIRGYTQPGYGVYSAPDYLGMPKKPKKQKRASREATRLREKIAENVHILMIRDYPQSKYRTPSKREDALAKDANTSWSTIQRILAPVKIKEGIKRRSLEADDGAEGVGTKIDTIADIAAVFGVRPADLLTPNFALSLLRDSVQQQDGEQSELHRSTGG